jgi:hypothetical protein
LLLYTFASPFAVSTINGRKTSRSFAWNRLVNVGIGFGKNRGLRGIRACTLNVVESGVDAYWTYDEKTDNSKYVEVRKDVVKEGTGTMASA